MPYSGDLLSMVLVRLRGSSTVRRPSCVYNFFILKFLLKTTERNCSIFYLTTPMGWIGKAKYEKNLLFYFFTCMGKMHHCDVHETLLQNVKFMTIRSEILTRSARPIWLYRKMIFDRRKAIFLSTSTVVLMTECMIMMPTKHFNYQNDKI